MLNILEFNKDFKKMYKTSLIKLNGTKLSNQNTFEMGHIDANTGKNINNGWQDRIRLKDYINVKPNSRYFIKSNIVTNIGLRFYDKNKKYLSYVFDKSPIVFDTPVDCYYIRFIVLTTNIDFIRIIIEPLKISQNLKIGLTFETGSINYSTGKDQNLASTLRTDFIEVQENETYKLRYYNSNIVYGLRCYDKDKNYINGEAINSNIISIPTGVNFIRLIRKDLSEPNEYLERIWKYVKKF